MDNQNDAPTLVPPPCETDEPMPDTLRNGKRPRGFALLSPERRQAISSKGGRAANNSGKAHRWTSDEAKVYGRKGGTSPRKNKQAENKSDFQSDDQAPNSAAA